MWDQFQAGGAIPNVDIFFNQQNTRQYLNILRRANTNIAAKTFKRKVSEEACCLRKHKFAL
jgi:hypothetical protein